MKGSDLMQEAVAIGDPLEYAHPWQPDQGDGTYRNPILYADYSDPDAIRVGDDFYLVASSFNCTPGLPILHSRDLVNWTLIGHALKNLPHTERRVGQLVRVEPPVFLNLYLLFAFEFQTYPTSLVHLGKTIELFQLHRWFGPETQSGPGAVAFPAGVERLTFEMVNMNFEALNNLWGILGGSHFPSVVYKVRLVRIAAAQDAPEPEITTIRLDAVVR